MPTTVSTKPAANRIRGVEGRRAQRAELARGALQALGIPAGEDDVGSLRARSSGRRLGQ